MRDKFNAQLDGLGVGFLPRFIAQPAFQNGSLIKVAVAHPRPNESFALAFNANDLGKAGQWFVEQLQRAALLLACFEK